MLLPPTRRGGCPLLGASSSTICAHAVLCVRALFAVSSLWVPQFATPPKPPMYLQNSSEPAPSIHSLCAQCHGARGYGTFGSSRKCHAYRYSYREAIRIGGSMEHKDRPVVSLPFASLLSVSPVAPFPSLALCVSDCCCGLSAHIQLSFHSLAILPFCIRFIHLICRVCADISHRTAHRCIFCCILLAAFRHCPFPFSAFCSSARFS
ncbi:hypothetical protein C8R45DRAFT_632246 [Mycena sanguinolenta]|nr:hypothetical protein C8R45DRAFT_632246 [Mycena sanguinolenta]